MNFDTDNWFEELDDEPELTDKKYRFKERVTRLMNTHNLLCEDAEEVVKTVIKTKENTSGRPNHQKPFGT